MLRCRLVSASLIASLLIATGTVARAGEPRALLELFTSQGCSSCPAADKLLGEFADDPSIVAVSLPLDIWDYLGWRDTLALPGHTARQRAYARVRGDRQVYTPQIVVDGSIHVLGSDRAAVERAVVQTRRNPAIMSAPVLVAADDNSLSVKVEPSENKHLAGEVWLCPVARAVAVTIGRGENHGRTITYYNVVRRWVKLGDWSGAESSWNIPASDIRFGDVDATAVIVQEGTREKPGVVLGAAFATFGQRVPEAEEPSATKNQENR